MGEQARAIAGETGSFRPDLFKPGSVEQRGSRGAIGQLWLGSVTTRVLSTSSVPVLVYREAPKPKSRTRKR